MTPEREKYICACSGEELYIRGELPQYAKEVKGIKKELSRNTALRKRALVDKASLEKHWKANAILFKIAKAKYMAVKRMLPKRKPIPKPEPTYYAYSLTGDYYSPKYRTGQEAIDDAVRELWSAGDTAANQEIYIGTCYNDFEPRINVDMLLEDLEQQAYDHSGEFAEDYLQGVTIKQRLELEASFLKVFNEWAKKYGHTPSWFLVDNYQIYKYKDCVALASKEVIEQCQRYRPEVTQ